MEKFAARLKELRLEKGISMETLAKKTGISTAAIQFWESGQRIPKLDYVIILAKFFGVSLDEMAGLTD